MRPWFTLGAALLAAGGGYWAWQVRQPDPAAPVAPPPPTISQTAPSAPAGDTDTLPPLSYPDLQGTEHSTSEWNDKVLVLNFWATWCPPCREETPLFVQLQEEYQARGVQFVGLAIDEPEAVQTFIDTYGVDYPVLIGDMHAMERSRRLGNRFRGLPFTLVVAPGGQIALRHTGGLKREQIEPVLQRLTHP